MRRYGPYFFIAWPIAFFLSPILVPCELLLGRGNIDVCLAVLSLPILASKMLLNYLRNGQI